MTIRSLADYPASYCPPIGKPLHYGTVSVVDLSQATEAEARGQTGRQLLFTGEETDAQGVPTFACYLTPARPAKAKTGGRIDTLGGRYIIVGGGKGACKRIIELLQG
jgi:hypothetical protein